MAIYQSTIKKVIFFCGKGIHSGKRSCIALLPREENFGIQFLLKKENFYIKGHIENSQAKHFHITLKKENHEIITIEHLIASLYLLNISNCEIQFYRGKEIPIFDGSALFFYRKIKKAGIQVQQSVQRSVLIKEEFRKSFEKSYIAVFPYPRLRISFKFLFPNKKKSPNFLHYVYEKKDFFSLEDKKILYSRTFGFIEDLKSIQSKGYAKGTDYSNTLAFRKSSGKILRAKLRHKNEIIFHKILDFIGILGLLPFRSIGHFYLINAGHYDEQIFINALYQKIAKD